MAAAARGERDASKLLLLAAAVSTLAILESNAKARVDPYGREFRVHNVKRGLQTHADLAMDSKGRTVVVWENHSPEGAYHVYARRFDNRGRPAGRQFMVDEGGDQGAGSPAVDVSKEGSFVVAWHENTSTGDTDVRFRVFSPRGRATTPEMTATSSSKVEGTAGVAVRKDGAFTVLWNLQQGTSSESDYDIRARRFTEKGVPVGEEFGVSERTALNQMNAAATYDPSGRLLVAWQSEKPVPTTPTATKVVVDARRFGRSGRPLGKEIQVSSDKPKVRLSRPQRASAPAIDTDSRGRYIIAWGSLIESGYGHIALARRFDSRGKRVGKERVLKANTRVYDDPPVISMDRKGRFVAVWGVTDAQRRIGDVQDLAGARFTRRGKRIGPMFRLHTRRPPNQVGGVVALGQDWRFVAVWVRYSMCGPPGNKYACRYDVLMRRWRA